MAINITKEKIDKLNRTEFVHFIENLILNSDQYKRDNDSNSYVIALDSPWGTGKTYLLELLNQDLESSSDICLIRYNAWENDYCENAFSPLIYDILNSGFFESDIDAESAKGFATALKNICIAWGKDYIKHKYDFDIDKTIDAIKDNAESLKAYISRTIPMAQVLEQERNSIKKFKEYLKNIADELKGKGRRILIVIDELDRCKPTFAIQTLEVVKHIFDIDNIVFLFAIDIKQLSHSISSVYGQGFDSTGYLCRFFDYIAKMPTSDIKPYIEERIKELKNIPNEKEFSPKKKDYDYWSNILADFFCDIYVAFDFSLRDLDTVIQSYKIMLNGFLKEYSMIGAHMIYVFCVALKYKNPRLFEEAFIEAFDRECLSYKEIEKKVTTHFNENFSIKTMITKLANGKTLQYINGKPFCDSKGESPWKMCRLDKINGDTVYLTDGIVFFAGKRQYSRHKINDFLEKSMENILFYPDIIRWEEIKNRTLREHIHKQLEMFNFVEETVEE